ncbi:MAG: ATP-binding protein [Alphaproteobacteria bacterium]
MDSAQPVAVPISSPGLQYFDRLFDAVKKTTVIQLRWPLVILCAYLLLYSPSIWLSPAQTDALLIFYLLTNATLYFVADEYFDSPYFYGPLLLFDTVFLAVVLAVSGGATPDFYVACCLTLVLSCICNDSRGLLVVTILAPVLYAYIIFNSVGAHDPSIYLRLPFPLVISLFYGYFAQVERLKRVARENEEHAKREHEAAEEIRRQRERLDVLQAINMVAVSKLDCQTILDRFLEEALAQLPHTAAIIRLKNPHTKVLETAAMKGIETDSVDSLNEVLQLADEMATGESFVAVAEAASDARIQNSDFYKRLGVQSLAAVPLNANGDRLGHVVLIVREKHDFGAEESGFLATLAGQVAMAIHSYRLFAQIHNQANELRRANQVKDQFLGVVSHELRTPLNVISGYTNMLVERMFGEVSPIQEKALQTIAHQSRELHGLINRLLQVSSIEAHTVHAEFNEVNFWELLAELRAFYEYPLDKDVKIVWEFPPDLPTLGADRGKLKHILENVINNAIKFTDKGSVTISAQYIAAKKWMEFKIADTGIGIPNDQLPLIFERFRQLDGSETRPYGGVGLGLYIASRYTAILGGTIHVDSKLGRGTIFTLRIPCKAKNTDALAEQLFLPVVAQNV